MIDRLLALKLLLTKRFYHDYLFEPQSLSYIIMAIWDYLYKRQNPTPGKPLVPAYTGDGVLELQKAPLRNYLCRWSISICLALHRRARVT